jgi:isopentenyldiphosphate isomerase
MPLTNEEMFEVVDKDGKVLDQKPRSEVHARGLRHKGVYLIILDRKGHIFLQQRAKDKDLMPSAWDLSVAEHLKPSETFTEAAQRGAREELGVKVRNLKLLGKMSFHFKYPGGEIDNELNHLFYSEFEGKINFKDGEVQNGRFVEICQLFHEMDQMPGKFTPWLRQCQPYLELMATR